MPPHIHMASDHAGFALKSALMLRLASLGYDLEDHGAHSADSCDYPVYARRLCNAVLQQRDRGDLGILICGTGIGMSIAANRIPGIRAALCASEFQARATRQHNDANVL
ncbi:MAG: RpiB/LacA/LacB family sugar-phosphate isomerase, partial [Desulfovibrionaceae bacterium]|nr:RpiB/LacA/LacB family sugar-phosphate isomerase [Desulfovibrionaceae bacterium]